MSITSVPEGLTPTIGEWEVLITHHRTQQYGWAEKEDYIAANDCKCRAQRIERHIAVMKGKIPDAKAS